MKRFSALVLALAFLAIAQNAWAGEGPEIPADLAPWLLIGTAGLIVALKRFR